MSLVQEDAYMCMPSTALGGSGGEPMGWKRRWLMLLRAHSLRLCRCSRAYVAAEGGDVRGVGGSLGRRHQCSSSWPPAAGGGGCR